MRIPLAPSPKPVVGCSGDDDIVTRSSRVTAYIHPWLEKENDKSYNMKGLPNPDDETTGIPKAWRIKMAQWYFEVVDYFDIDRVVALIALHFVDRCRAKQSFTIQERREFQLLAVVSLRLSHKIHSKWCDENLKMSCIIVLTRQLFQPHEIHSFELKLMAALDYKLNPPLPIYFADLELQNLNRDLRLLDEDRFQELLNMVRYVNEVQAFEGNHVFSFLPSEIAVASIMASLGILSEIHCETWSESLIATLVGTCSERLLSETSVSLDGPTLQDLSQTLRDDILQNWGTGTKNVKSCDL